jgi:hypothetical protein
MSNNTAGSLLDIGLSPAEEIVSAVTSLLLLVFCMGMCIYNICRVTHKKQPFCLCCLIPVKTSCCGLYPKPAPDRQYAEDAYEGGDEQPEEGTGARFLAPNFTGSYMNTLYPVPHMVMNGYNGAVDVNSHHPYRTFQEV